MLIQLTQTQWLALSAPVKARLKEIFAIPRSEGTHMVDNRVLSDGHNHRDLSLITIEKMQDYLGHPRKEGEPFYDVFEQVLARVEYELTPPPTPVQEATVIVKPAEELFIEHNGKTYKLTEVVQGAQPQVAPNAPLYPAPTNGPLTPALVPTGAGKKTGKGVTRGGGKGRGAAKAK